MSRHNSSDSLALVRDDAISRWPLTTFFALAFLFTWALLPIARTSIPVSLLALFGPAAAAVVTAALAGREQLHDLRARVLHWRVPAHRYLIALLLPLPITALRSGLEYLLGARGAIDWQPISPLSALVFVLVAGEEIGWRGFAQPRLVERYGNWLGCAILGVLWAFWHLPLFYLSSMPQFGSPFPPFIGYTIALSLLLVWLTQRTGGSLIIATLFHGAVNTFGLVNTAATSEVRGWSNAVCYLVAAIVVSLMFGVADRTKTEPGR